MALKQSEIAALINLAQNWVDAEKKYADTGQAYSPSRFEMVVTAND